MFFKVNGFIYVTSVLLSLEGRLTEADVDPDVLNLLYIVFHTVNTAMRFEPANAKFFYHEICMTSLCDTIRLLGCFSSERIETIPECNDEITNNSFQESFHNLFVSSVLNPK